MNGTTLLRLCVGMILLGATACRPLPRSAPSGPADLTGQVEEERVVGTLGGVSFGAASGGSIHRLRVRIIGSRTTTPGMKAYVGVDGITQLVRRDAPGSDDRPEMEGAFVRIWFRGPPRTATPTELVAMARIVTIDSLAAPEAKQ
ncbi:MAG: hypothetical protein ACJ8AD_01230 [Gemmatimonadaceae bacterium]